jgi:hypothetical protein
MCEREFQTYQKLIVLQNCETSFEDRNKLFQF